MPRYFFHVGRGQMTVLDQEGIELPNPKQSRATARLDGKPPRNPSGRHAGTKPVKRKIITIPVNQRLGFPVREFAALLSVSYPTIWRGIPRQKNSGHRDRRSEVDSACVCRVRPDQGKRQHLKNSGPARRNQNGTAIQTKIGRSVFYYAKPAKDATPVAPPTENVRPLQWEDDNDEYPTARAETGRGAYYAMPEIGNSRRGNPGRFRGYSVHYTADREQDPTDGGLSRSLSDAGQGEGCGATPLCPASSAASGTRQCDPHARQADRQERH